ncbi:hypothetical protein THAOC_07549 [Thalassiosira oceanica]|uniref:Uncharacterized protein n=1 Tax=Thalassiosira oceanica TaxID=159749 RepID=K0SX89_THAOC|nr:hypothetical protein THAOC_07549 [Thalassiosira oceanica]|eukprot:EJK71043.1 hypothetical protein THAOC_07549 [Thalassiosira oceanica]
MAGYVARNFHFLDGLNRSIPDVGEGRYVALVSRLGPVAIAIDTAINAARRVAQLASSTKMEDEHEENVVFESETAAGVEDYKLWLDSEHMPFKDACDGRNDNDEDERNSEMSPVAKENISLKDALQKSITTCRRIKCALHDCNAKVQQKDEQILSEQRRAEEASKKHEDASNKCESLQNQIEDMKQEASEAAQSLNRTLQIWVT